MIGLVLLVAGAFWLGLFCGAAIGGANGYDDGWSDGWRGKLHRDVVSRARDTR